MPCDNYNFDYEPSGVFEDLNKKCFTFDAPVDVEWKLKDPVTFISQTYYRTNFVTPNMCCCGGGGCGPEPTPPTPPCPPDPPCPPVPPCPPEPGCQDGVVCNGTLYDTIEAALEDNPCTDEIIVGCGVFVLPPSLVAGLCIKGEGQEHTTLLQKNDG